MLDTTKKNWWKQAVVYQVYPKSFADTTGSGEGDLSGITAHLDYLAQLGVDILWLSPIYASPQKDNGYDVADFCAVDPRYGTLEDFAALTAAAAERGIRVMMDMVLNHTSSEHTWFREAVSDPGSSRRKFYIWSDQADSATSVFGDPAWTWSEEAGQYYYSSFSPHQPDLEWRNPEVRQAIYGVMRFWLRQGVAGFRLDAVPFISKDLAAGKRCQGPELHTYLQEMRRALGPDVILGGEDTEADLDDVLLYTDPSRAELNWIFEFGFEDYDRRNFDKWQPVPLDVEGLKQHYAKWQTELAPRGRMALFVGNHDTPRIVSRWGDDTRWRRESATAIATAVYLLEGNVVLYQGEEIGMTNTAMPITSYDDLETLNFWRSQLAAGAEEAEVLWAVHASSRDNARTPMQWTGGPQAGFTTGTPWLPVNPNCARINVQAAEADPDSVLHYYRRLLKLRKAEPALAGGTFRAAETAGSPVFAYTRTLGDDEIQVACNLSAEQQESPFSGGTLLLGNYPEGSGPLRPYEARVIRAACAK